MTCPTCRSEGFKPSLLGPQQCQFCDGTANNEGPNWFVCKKSWNPEDRLGIMRTSLVAGPLYENEAREKANALIKTGKENETFVLITMEPEE